VIGQRADAIRSFVRIGLANVLILEHKMRFDALARTVFAKGCFIEEQQEARRASSVGEWVVTGPDSCDVCLERDERSRRDV